MRRYDFAIRELPGHGLKAVARYFGIAGANRELIRGDLIYETFRTDPERVRRYATADVAEVAALARLLGGAAYALAQLAPRRYERLAWRSSPGSSSRTAASAASRKLASVAGWSESCRCGIRVPLTISGPFS